MNCWLAFLLYLPESLFNFAFFAANLIPSILILEGMEVLYWRGSLSRMSVFDNGKIKAVDESTERESPLAFYFQIALVYITCIHYRMPHCMSCLERLKSVWPVTKHLLAIGTIGMAICWVGGQAAIRRRVEMVADTTSSRPVEPTVGAKASPDLWELGISADGRLELRVEIANFAENCITYVMVFFAYLWSDERLREQSQIYLGTGEGAVFIGIVAFSIWWSVMNALEDDGSVTAETVDGSLQSGTRHLHFDVNALATGQ